MKILETERLILRPYEESDFAPLHAMFSDAETMAHYPHPFSEEETRAWIARNQKRYADYGFGLWAAVLKENGQVIGDCGLTLQPIHGTMLPEVGFHISKRYQRRGFAREAARAVRDWAFENTDYPEMYCYQKYTNTASRATAQSMGMVQVDEYADPVNTVTTVYAIRREDLPARKAAEAAGK